MKKLPCFGRRTLAYQVGIHQYEWEDNRLEKLDKPPEATVTNPGVVMEGQHHARDNLASASRLLAFLVSWPVQENALGYHGESVVGQVKEGQADQKLKSQLGEDIDPVVFEIQDTQERRGVEHRPWY